MTNLKHYKVELSTSISPQKNNLLGRFLFEDTVQLGTDPVAVWRLTVYVDAVAESGRNPVSKHQPIRFTPSVENERANVGWDGRTRLARPNFQARTRTVTKSFFPIQRTTSRIGNNTRLIQTLLKVLDHIYVLYIL